MKLRHLRGLGPKSESALNDIGIFSKEDLKQIGPVRAYIKLQQASSVKVSLNFLYAMVGALEDKDWLTIAKHDKQALLMALEGFKELEAQIKADGLDFEI